MSADRQRVEAVLAEATAIGEARARAAYLMETCAGDEELRREVESLLAAHDEAGTFLQQPAPGAPLGVPPSGGRGAGPAEAGTPNAPAPLAEQPGDRIGRYKLLEKIGEGGMGSVWMAEQEEPVRRRVALKVIKLGMDTREVVARFEAERQALALMDHPNIAKVFDGGATSVAANWRSPQTPSPVRAELPTPPQAGAPSVPAADTSPPLQEIPAGRPFFVMELVRGIRITDYCDQHRLSTAQRLEMFGQVCGAVQHAHQKGIIHRDLKPSNILVTEQDARPVVKVIDFGIAKATDQQLTDKTVFTRFMQFMGTPAYMSPEQAELSSRDIDTRSDIYSLGVLLYELLTGRTPFDSKALLAAGLDEMRRVIREQEPPRPSTRLTELVAADVRRLKISSTQPSTINPQPDSDRASSRRLLQEKNDLIREIRGDLDWIVMKCLEKDRARRYETANGLAQDIDRYLHDEPVLARPPSTGYRIQKFARKHRGSVVAAAAFVALLAVATAVSSVFAVRANQQRAKTEKAQHHAEAQTTRAVKAEGAANENARQAKESEAEARAVLQFFQDEVLAAARPENAREGGLGRNVTLHEAVDASEPKVGKYFAEWPLVEASIRKVLGQTYLQLGDHAEAIQQLRRAFDLLAIQLGTNHPRTVACMGNLGTAYADAEQFDDAIPLLEDALRITRSQRGSDSALFDYTYSMARGYLKAGRTAEGASMAEEALEFGRRKSMEDAKVLQAINLLAVGLKRRGRIAEAARFQQQALDGFNAKFGPNHRDTLMMTVNLAETRRSMGQWTNALSLLEPALRELQTKLGHGHPDTAAAATALAKAYVAGGRMPEAISLLTQTLDGLKTKLGSNDPRTLDAFLDLAWVHERAGRLQDSVSLLAERLELLQASYGLYHRQSLSAASDLGWARMEAGQLAEAEVLLRRALNGQTNANPPDISELADTAARLGLCLLRLEKYAEAETAFRQCLVIYLAQKDKQTAASQTQRLLGRALLGQNKYEQAEPLLVEDYEHLQKREAARPSGSGQQRVKEAAGRLVQLYEAWGKPEQAAQWREKMGAPAKPPEKIQP